ncbi:hypothetical protein CUMW_183020 [Citrus unshiu]|uniref:Uncharacterized protein n=1 Tax=Citrus unshiu TaxID=55188 RepID=A0A2H5PZT3_CITUN|nr:hypothetical protein CUMW_183020 [Citrus unshiu]GAY57906.1 hypothetical protein CUMW_183020 [Citrus unshiu]GAY57907.1 hypothetical protein CUMW_183020 [Citrus unshiu]GAY57908.1 hypothetical protein CUMW_183020 [Citrus unshiu]
MASKPGILTEWPWKPLGSYKHVVLAPWAMHSIYCFIGSRKSERDYAYFLIFPFLLLRMLHDQIWISLSRYRTAKRNNRIVDKAIEFDQVDRERNWDDQIVPHANSSKLFKPAFLEKRWCDSYDSGAYGSGRVSLLLVPQSTAPPLSLLSLPFSSPFFNCHRAHYFCDSSIR